MEKKKKTNWLQIILIILFIAYISLSTLNVTGYYDGSIRRKVEFTEEQIKEFESDVESGKKIDINDYLKGQTKNYTNRTSQIGYEFSSSIDSFLNNGLKDIMKVLGRLFT